LIATRARLLAGLALCLVFAGSSNSHASQPALRLLFIGNSLTAANDLPGLVATLAQAGGQQRPDTRMVAVGGFSLEDHWNQGTRRIAYIQRSPVRILPRS
jgi:hypothetical protein